MTRSAARIAIFAAAASALLASGCTAALEDATAPPSTPTPASLHESQQPSAYPDGVTSVSCDTATHARDTAVTVLSDTVYGVGGWSHINGVGSYSTVALPVGAYQITAEHYQPNASCSGAHTLSTVLVKRTYDWNQQHANGIESSFPTRHLTFGEVTDIVVELRFDPEKSHLPTAEELSAAYGDLLNSDQLATLDSGDINLELTLFGAGATADQPFMNAGALVTIDPQQAAKGWVRVQIPRDQLTFYTEDNYVRTEVGADAFQDLLVQGLRINPETGSGMVVRDFVGDAFDVKAKPELFKEMALTFALIEVGRTPS